MVGPEDRLVVVNMAKWPDDLWWHLMYCCPAQENDFQARYRQYPAQFLAGYWQKGARRVARVNACVRLNAHSDHEVLWRFCDEPDDALIARAERLRNETNRNPIPCLVYVLSELCDTDFVYDHNGGFQSSRSYFDISGIAHGTTAELATALRTVPWSRLPKVPAWQLQHFEEANS